MSTKSPTEVELIKARSRHLRGTLEDSVQLSHTGGLLPDDTHLLKLHGMYQQDDRDLRQERTQQKLEPLFSFMLRGRVPGGVISCEQWLAIDETARELTHYGTLRLTTRQTFQFHGIFKQDLKTVVKHLVAARLDSIAACGDVNRNVIAATNPEDEAIHTVVHQLAVQLSEQLLPKSRAYFEIWLDAEKVDLNQETEPMYSDVYLPRKFKIAIAVPPDNEVDVRAHDLGFIAIVDNGRIVGYNVTVGGGMGTTHGDAATHPRLADDLGFIQPDAALSVAEAVLTTQRDHGNRTDRKQARLKYTIERMGLDVFRSEVEHRTGLTFEPTRSVQLTRDQDYVGWRRRSDGKWNLTLFIDGGRLQGERMDGMREIARAHRGHFRMTANQNLIIAGVADVDKAHIESLARQSGLLVDGLSKVRLQAMACVALPTCSLAMAEAERYLPAFTGKVEKLLHRHGLGDLPLTMRISGCPNGCSRPYVAEIALVGKGPGHYNLMLGGDTAGGRLNRLYKENINEAEILFALDELFARYAHDRQHGESFGDYVARSQVVMN